MMTFALSKATYSNEYPEDKDATRLTAIDPNACVGAFRVMGSVTPGADWAANQVTLKLTYNVSGMPAKDFANKRVAQSGEQNLVSSAVEPTLASSGSLTPATINANSPGSTPVKITFVNGTNESLITEASTYTVGVKNANAVDPLDITAISPIAIAANTGIPSISIPVQDLLNQGVLVNGANQFVITFTATDGHVTTLTTGNISVSNIA